MADGPAHLSQTLLVDPLVSRWSGKRTGVAREGGTKDLVCDGSGLTLPRGGLVRGLVTLQTALLLAFRQPLQAPPEIALSPYPNPRSTASRHARCRSNGS